MLYTLVNIHTKHCFIKAPITHVQESGEEVGVEPSAPYQEHQIEQIINPASWSDANPGTVANAFVFLLVQRRVCLHINVLLLSPLLVAYYFIKVILEVIAFVDQPMAKT